MMPRVLIFNVIGNSYHIKRSARMRKYYFPVDTLRFMASKLS